MLNQRMFSRRRQSRVLPITIAGLVACQAVTWFSSFSRSDDRVVTARSFALEDEDGNVRARLEMSDGAPQLTLLGKGGKLEAMLLGGADRPGLVVCNGEGKPGAYMLVNNGAGAISLQGKTGLQAVTATAEPDGGAFTLRDSENKERLVMYAGKARTYIDLQDPSEAQRVRLCTLENVDETKSRMSGLMVFDAYDKLRLMFGDVNGSPKVVVQDSEGNAVFSKP